MLSGGSWVALSLTHISSNGGSNPIVPSSSSPAPMSLYLTIFVALVSSGTLWGILQWLLNKRTRRAEEERQEAAKKLDEETRRKIKREREDAVEEALSKAQLNVFRVQDDRHRELKADYERTSTKLDDLQTVAEALLKAFDKMFYGAIIDDVTGMIMIKGAQEDIDDMRAQMRKARALIY